MREELLAIIEKNSRIDLKELAVILGVEEIDVVNELAALEAEGIIFGYHTLINWDDPYNGLRPHSGSVVHYCL